MLNGNRFLGVFEGAKILRKIEITTVYFDKKTTDENKKGRRLYEIISSLEAGVFFVVVLFVFLVRGVGVEGISMEPTLENGDFVIVSSHFHNVERGDIVVIAPYNELKTPIVKRVIGVEGDVVDIDFENHKVFVNSEEIEEPYIGALTARSYDVEFPLTVKEDTYFVMGDNRNDSLDSRDSKVGLVPEDMVFGKVLFKMIPFGKVY